MPAENLTYTAQWSNAPYFVTFMVDGRMYQKVGASYGNTIWVITEPSKTGYDFMGWFTAEDDTGTRWDFATNQVTENTTLYAHWEVQTYNITLHLNGGSMTDDDTGEIHLEYTYGEAYALPTEADLTPPAGYVFADWHDNPQLEGVHYTEIPEGATGDKVFYAKWEVETIKIADYTETYDGQDHELTFTLPVADDVEDYQWYFKANTAGAVFVPVQGTAYNKYAVRDVSQSGTYYCVVTLKKLGEIHTESCTVSITPKTLTVTGKDNVEIKQNGMVSVSSLYTIEGICGTEKLTANTTLQSITGKNGTVADFAEMVKNAGEYTVVFAYNGFTGEGSSNYTGTDTFTVTITVKSGGSGGGGGGGGGGTTAYTVKFETNGGSEIADQSVNAGGLVKEPDAPVKKGYDFVGWYTDETLKTPYDFAEKVTKSFTLYAKWEKSDGIADPDDTGVSGWLNTGDHKAYLNGYSDGTFGPGKQMTRAEAAQMFYNLLLDKDIVVSVDFDDVPFDAWYAQAVNTLASLGIIKGVGNGLFDPERPITRAEFTVIAMRFAKPAEMGENIFSDVSESDWFYEQVVSAVRYGWINGYSDGTFKPQNTITRAEVTALVNHMLARSADKAYVDANLSSLRQFSDVVKENWAYYEIMEAANSHDYSKDSGTESWTRKR